VTVGVLQIADHPLHPGEDSIAPALVAAAAAIVLTAFAFSRGAMTVLEVATVVVLSLAAVAFAYFLPADDLARNVLGGVIVVLAALWAVMLGQSGRHPIGQSIGLVAFGLEVIYVYVFTIGTRLDTALAFLIGGVLFIVLAFVLYRIDRLLARRAAAAEIVADLKRAPLQPVPMPDLPESLRSIALPEQPPPPSDEGEAKP
jgi:hypothetical protein